ncbi:hypothetical protein ACVWY5_006963 [Bradyrhizobium sp. USDA 3256]
MAGARVVIDVNNAASFDTTMSKLSDETLKGSI